MGDKSNRQQELVELWKTANDLTDNERVLLEQVKSHLKEQGAYEKYHDSPILCDLRLRRFLRGNEHSVNKAVRMVLATLKWREEKHIDDLFETWTPPEELNKVHFPGGLLGYDIDGNSVMIWRYGHVDVSSLLSVYGDEAVLKVETWRQESYEHHLVNECIQKKRMVDTLTVVIDFEGLSMYQLLWPSTLSFLSKIIRQASDNYPERLKRAIVIRAPSAFPVAWGLIEKFLDSDTTSKVVVLGHNYLDELQKYVHLDQLPAFLGGSIMIDGDPECRSVIPSAAKAIKPSSHQVAPATPPSTPPDSKRASS